MSLKVLHNSSWRWISFKPAISFGSKAHLKSCFESFVRWNCLYKAWIMLHDPWIMSNFSLPMIPTGADFYTILLVAHLNTKASLLDVMIGRPGMELSPAKWYDWINFPFSADCVEQPLSKSARNSKSKFSSFDSEKVAFRHLLPAISISSSLTKNQSAISFLPERSFSSSLKSYYH